MKVAARAGAAWPITLIFLLAALCMPFQSMGGAASERPARPEGTAAITAEDLLIPFPAAGVPMHARLFRPSGKGPFPLAVISHASEQDAYRRALMPPPSYPALADWLLRHGYAVMIPERPGHGRTGGPYLEDQGTCENPDYVRAGNATADAIAIAIASLAADRSIRRDGIVVLGNSAGGWGALAYAARNPPGVRAIVNFSGGRGGHDRGRPGHNCAPDRLVAAAAAFGRTARVPTLWLYAANDTFFPPSLSARMADTFHAAGGKVEYRLLPAVGVEGHALIQAPPTVAPWPVYLERFLSPRR